MDEDTFWICSICCLKVSKDIAWARRIMDRMDWAEGTCEVCMQDGLVGYYQKFKQIEDSVLGK